MLTLVLLTVLLASGCATLAPPVEHEEEITSSVSENGKEMTQEERDKEEAAEKRIWLREYFGDGD
jgi:hypothetical protein